MKSIWIEVPLECSLILDKRAKLLVEGSAKNVLDLQRLDIIYESLLLQFHLPHNPITGSVLI